jgi:hypothetical protein
VTSPQQYQTKATHQAYAVLYDNTQGSIDSLVAWMNQHYGSGDEMQYYTTPMGVLVLHIDNNPLLQVQPDQYVYNAGVGGIKVASKGTFEMYYEPVPNGA